MATRGAPGEAAGEERALKLYRYVSDIARRIDEAIPACRSSADLFTTYLEGNRQKLRDNCEKLMFLQPLLYGRKSLELLWRKAYYDTVSTAKKLRDKEEACDEYIFTHIMCGIGHYHHIISRIITEMDLQLSSLDYPPVDWDDDVKIVAKTSVDGDLKQWGAGIVHSCLIYLGDLSRYQSEMFDDSDVSIAARYYLLAAHMDLCSGMPYNQLGNLYTDQNHNLDSVCYYIHCLGCAVPFEGAKGNLSRLFEKNAQYVESISSEQVDGLPQFERVRLTIARVLTLAENWYQSKENVDIAQLCNATAHDLKVCLGYQPPMLPDINKNYEVHLQIRDDEILNPSYLNDDAIYKIVLVCLFCIDKLNEVDANRAFAVKAFTLALFSQLLQKLLERMHKCGFQNPSRHMRRPTHQYVLENYNNDPKLTVRTEEQTNGETLVDKPDVKVNGHLSEVEEEKLVNGNGKSNGKKTTAKRRRRRRLNSSESTEVSADETESSSTETDKSDTEDGGSSGSENTYVSDESNNELSDDEDVIIMEEMESQEKVEVEDEKSKITSKLINKTDKSSVLKEHSEAKGKLDEADIQKFLRGDNFLPSLKLLQDWVLTETDLIMSCGESGDALFQSVVDLLNILQANFKNASSKSESRSKILSFAKSTAAKLNLEYKVIPLPEDVNLRGTNICKFDKDAAEWMLLKKYNPTVYEENVIRILNFINFGHQIAKIVPRIRYNRSTQVFFMNKSSATKTAARVHRKELKNKKAQRSAPHAAAAGDASLMRSLGKLWLQSRVRELESAVRTGGREALPAYAVVDSDALAHHTHLVKQLVRLRRLVVLVPAVVLQSIDELKKEQSGARDAIRWLEAQLQSGSRFLRTQRPSETRPLPLLKYPRKAPKQVHQFMQIIEFCHHFVAKDDESPQGGNGEPEDAKRKNNSVLVLLTGSKLSDSEDVKDFSYTGVARSAGVPVDSIVHFVAKWRHLVNKAGKKR